MGKQRLAWVSGTVVVLILLMIGAGRYLQQRNCWDCTASERYARGTELLCDQDADVAARGLDFICHSASQGQPEAQALAGELFLQTLPGRYASINRDLFECSSLSIVADRERAQRYFMALALDGQVSPEMEFNLGVLIEEGIIESPLPNKGADDYFRSAAKQGDPRAMYEIGMREDRQKNYVEAARRFSESFSRVGHPGAALMLGDYNFFGRLGAVDLEHAIAWYQKAQEAAQNPEFTGIAASLAQRAEQRLIIATGHQQRTGGKGAILVPYRLAGGLSEYRVYVANSQTLMGRVVREGGLVIARFVGTTGAEGAAVESEVANMNDGLNWILERYAVDRYGPDKKFRFVLASD